MHRTSALELSAALRQTVFHRLLWPTTCRWPVATNVRSTQTPAVAPLTPYTAAVGREFAFAGLRCCYSRASIVERQVIAALPTCSGWHANDRYGRKRLNEIKISGKRTRPCFNSFSDRLYSLPTDFIVFDHHHSVSRSGLAEILCTVRSAPLNSSSGSRRMPTLRLSRP